MVPSPLVERRLRRKAKGRRQKEKGKSKKEGGEPLLIYCGFSQYFCLLPFSFCLT
jgi:hypothetical protein